jgi:hypothetical protein
MHDHDMPEFLALLNDLGAMCTEEVSERRQRLYWEFFRDGYSIDEWVYACNQAMWRESFPKIPMPAILREYMVEYRKASLEERKQRELRQPRPSPEDDAFALEQLRAIQASLFKDDRLKDPPPPYETEAV